MFATGCCGSSSSTTAGLAAFPSLSYSSTVKTQKTNLCSLPNPNFFRPNSNFGSNLTLNFSRLKICHTTRKQLQLFHRVLVSCLIDDISEAYPESGQPSSVSNDSVPGATIDIKLPRRSLLVHFTCNACGERSQKLINRLAYEKGTVYVQCSGCSQYHKLVDNLSLVVEYDFREEINSNTDADQA